MAKRPIKILHITPHLGGGVGSVLINYLKKNKNNSSFLHKVICLEYANEYSLSALRDAGIYLRDKMASDHEGIKGAVIDADIVLIHWWNHPLLYDFLIREKLPASRVIIWSHVAGFHPPFVFTKKILEYPDMFVFTTPMSLKAKEVRMLSERQKRLLRVVWSTRGVECFGSIIPKNHSGFNIGYLGTVDYAKIHPKFISICNKIKIPGARFIVCGGSNEIELKKETEALGVENKFKFTGLISDVSEYLSIFDVFGYPLAQYHYGTCDQALAEAMAAGVVPVVLNNRMEKLMVKNGVTGIVAKNETDYLKAIKRLHDDKSLRSKLSYNARGYALKTFSLDKMIHEWEAVFGEAMELPKTSKKWNFRSNGKPTSKDIFLESLGDYSNSIVSYCNASTKKEKKEAIAGIEKLNSLSIWNAATRGTVHHYSSFFPEDKHLSLWSKTMRALENKT